MLNITSQSWKAVKKKLTEDREALLEAMLIENGHDRTNKLRGKVEMIDEILATYPRDLTRPAQGDE